MKLNLNGISQTETWLAKGYQLPTFDLAAVRQKTREQPIWLHFGAGNIFRGFPAVLQQELLNKGLADRGIIVCEAYDEQIIDAVYTPHDNLGLLVTLRGDGSVEKKVVASIVEALKASNSLDRLKDIFAAPSLQMVSFTITEKGYSLKLSSGDYAPAVKADMEALPEKPASLMGLLTLLCYHRFLQGAQPLAMVSMDNCSHNGTLLNEAIKTMAAEWDKRGLVQPGFTDYINNQQRVSFTWSMIDKITPRPSAQISQALSADGFEDTTILQTEKHTFIAPFVNAEQSQYLVIEDAFPNGRPQLEKAGCIFTNRATVDQVETMKVCTCLNPLHTVLAVYGCLLGYQSISDEMKNPLLKAFIEKVGYDEGLPVVVHPGIIEPTAFIKEVIEQRFPNPYVPDTPQRIASDTSQKIPVRFGETLKAYIKSGKKDIRDLTYIPLFFAGWLRYLMGLDDQGQPFDLSPDPMLAVLKKTIDGISLGDQGPFDQILKPILSDSRIFGLDLCQTGLDKKVLQMFTELNAGSGAVAATLAKYIPLG